MQTFYWIALNVALLIAMLLLVPIERIRQLFVYGLLGGTGLAVIVFAVANAFHLWETVGTIEIGDYIRLLPSIAWFFPVVIFGNFFPKSDSFLYRAGYVLLFAMGAVVAELVLDYFGMWQNIHWGPFSTFLLAIATHTILAVYLMYTEQYLSE